MCLTVSRSDRPRSDRLYFLCNSFVKKFIERNNKFETAIGQTEDGQTGF